MNMPEVSMLVTGVAGVVGSRLAKALVWRVDRVIGRDSVNHYDPVAHKQRDWSGLGRNFNFRFIKADLQDAGGLARIFAEHRPGAVAHLAAMAAVRYSVEHPLIYGTVNVQGTMNLLE